MNKVRLFTGGVEVPVSFLQFSGGEIHPRIESDTDNTMSECTIIANTQNSIDVMSLLMLTSAVKELWFGVEITLVLPYVPYGRQDRVANKGEAFSLKVFCDLINSQGYSRIITYDTHSDVTAALLTKIDVIHQSEFVKRIPLDRKSTILVSPDYGASKKTSVVAKCCGYNEVYQASKFRNTLSGEISGVKVDGNHIGARNFLLVDDICDGGRTFIELASELKKLTDGDIYLYVTHGIFSRGLDVLINGGIKHIYTANCFSESLTSESLTTIDHEVSYEN